MAEDIVTRFAPSPTGRLHLGHAWSAMLAHDSARARDGRFLLRIEDIDGGRSRPEHIAGIVEDLRWLGLECDGDILFQSHRLDAYREALGRLDAMGLLYRCTCTRADIAASTSAPQGEAAPPYPGTCRRRYDGDPVEPFAWRIDMARAAALAGPLSWHEDGQRRIAADPQAHGDVVLARKDAPASYHLAVTVDDAFQGVTLIVRGRDLFEATAVQRLLQSLLGLPEPHYLHHRLIGNAAGKRLAKRDRAPTLQALRVAGENPMELLAMMRNGRFPFGFSLLSP